MSQAVEERDVRRGELYGCFSSLFYYPQPETWEFVRSGALLGELGLSEEAIETCLRSVDSSESLTLEYQRVFGHTMSPECPIYETQYGMAHIFMQTQELGDIGGFYKAFGVSLGTRASERQDHLSVELEFMSFLVHKENYARSRGDGESATLCREAQARFMNDHLGRWVPVFASRLVKQESEGLYVVLAQALEKFIKEEFQVLGVSPAPMRVLDAQAPFPEPVGGSPCDDAESCPYVPGRVFEGESKP